MFAVVVATICAAAPVVSQEPVSLEPAVDAAVERGVDYLLAAQLRDGSWEGYRGAYDGGVTALCVHTLLHAGLEADHPAVARGLAFLEHVRPREVYTVSSMILAWEASHARDRAARIEPLARQLLEWRRGTWGYPFVQQASEDEPWGRSIGRADLSNTQMAVLALHAAERAGVDVPDKVWLDVAREALGFREAVTTSDRRTAGAELAAGFTYERDDGAVTGSMTAAGVVVLSVCRGAVERKLPAADAEAIDEARAAAVRWLEQRWDLAAIPGREEDRFLRYYQYGLERVAGLAGLARWDDPDGYAEGARQLIAAQEDDGSWGPDDRRSDTCFALLFLTRATAQQVTGARRAPPDDLFLAEREASSVRVRASGDPETTVWITGLDLPADTRVERVELVVDGQVVGVLEEREGRFATRHHFERNGEYELRVRVALEGGDALEGDPLPVRIDEALEPWMLTAAGARARNLLLDAEVEATASTQYTAWEGPEKAFDGREDTRWFSSADDRAPALRLELARPVRADTLVLNQCVSCRANRALRERIVRLELRVNGERTPIEVTLEPDVVVPTAVDLGRAKPIRELELRVVEQTREASIHAVGFTEVALERRR